ncbi:MAG: hypothetical protein JWN53_1706 [Gemmatimonadetes bacterium]|nr:hypothetical protein [Gemmatimonadota bacterium]
MSNSWWKSHACTVTIGASVALAACAHGSSPESAPAPSSAATSAPAPSRSPIADTTSRSPAPSANGGSVVREYRGAYTSGFEMSWFEPCEAASDDAIWWVTLTGEAVEQRDSLLKLIKSPARNGLAVRWRGSISPRMRAGHMGRGTRYMLVTQVLDIRPLPDGGACLTGRAS